MLTLNCILLIKSYRNFKMDVKYKSNQSTLLVIRRNNLMFNLPITNLISLFKISQTSSQKVVVAYCHAHITRRLLQQNIYKTQHDKIVNTHKKYELIYSILKATHKGTELNKTQLAVKSLQQYKRIQTLTRGI